MSVTKLHQANRRSLKTLSLKVESTFSSTRTRQSCFPPNSRSGLFFSFSVASVYLACADQLNVYGDQVRRTAFECLVRIHSEYYDHMQQYIQDVFNLTVKAAREDAEEVALQAIELWSTLCEYEMPEVRHRKQRASGRSQNPECARRASVTQSGASVSVLGK